MAAWYKASWLPWVLGGGVVAWLLTNRSASGQGTATPTNVPGMHPDWVAVITDDREPDTNFDRLPTMGRVGFLNTNGSLARVVNPSSPLLRRRDASPNAPYILAPVRTQIVSMNAQRTEGIVRPSAEHRALVPSLPEVMPAVME